MLSSYFQKYMYFTCDRFYYSYEGLKIANLPNLGQLTRDILLSTCKRPINSLMRKGKSFGRIILT